MRSTRLSKAGPCARLTPRRSGWTKLAMAAKQGVTIEAEVGDAQDWAPEEAFDAIGLCYLHTPPALREAFHPRVMDWPSRAAP